MPFKSQLPELKRPYKRNSETQSQMKSIAEVLRVVLNNSEISIKHKKEVIKIMLWNVSQIDGKYSVRYRSEGVLSDEDEKVQHEHVITRKETTRLLLENPQGILEILEQVLACVVTESEHKKLSAIKDVSGWERYKQAGIKVYDAETCEWI